MLRHPAQRGWWETVRKEALVAELLDYVDFESVATIVRAFKIDLVPGLLQTPRYAAAIDEAFVPSAPAEVIQERVDVRAERQERVSGETPNHGRAVQLWKVALSQNKSRNFIAEIARSLR